MKDTFPKCPVCKSEKGYVGSGILGKYAQCLNCGSKWKLNISHGLVFELMLHELPNDGKAVYTIKSKTMSGQPLYSALGQTYRINFWKKLELENKINWDLFAESVSPEASGAVMLEPDEKLLHQWSGFRETIENRVINGNTKNVVVPECGVLLLSNQKLYWIQVRESGIFRKTKTYLLVHDLNLENIKGISGETGDSKTWAMSFSLPKTFSIVDENCETRFRLQFALLDTFKPIIEKAAKLRKIQIKKEKKKERVHFMLDFSFLKKYMENGGLVMKVLKCPHCDGKVTFPEGGSQITCTYCGNEILAQDIFEKVKSIIE